MVARKFDLEREVQKTFVELRRQQIAADRRLTASEPNMTKARALRRKQAKEREANEPQLLVKAREIAVHRQELFLFAQQTRQRRQANFVIREAEYQAERAAEAVRKAQAKADEAQRLAERVRRRERSRLVITIPDDA